MHSAPPPVQNERMVTLRIRGVPESLRDALVKEAKERRQSLPAYLLELIETRADRAGSDSPFAKFAGRNDGVRTLPGEIAAELAAERAEREEWLASR